MRCRAFVLSKLGLLDRLLCDPLGAPERLPGRGVLGHGLSLSDGLPPRGTAGASHGFHMELPRLRQWLLRAAEIQVRLLPDAESARCRPHLRHVADFVVKKPRFHASLSGFLQLYCRKLLCAQ